MKKFMFTVSVVLFFIIGVLIGSRISNSKEINYIKQDVKLLSNIRRDENIVFLGDSITDGYPIDEIFLNLPIVNSGISGYKTQDVLDSMDELVYQYNPTSVFLLIGTNDLRGNISRKKERKIEGNIVKIVNGIKKHRKNAEIYIISIYPVNNSLNEEIVGDRDNKKIREINTFLKDYCDEYNFTYIDMYKYLADKNGDLNKKYTDDGLHTNHLGYARISQVLLPYLYDINIKR